MGKRDSQQVAYAVVELQDVNDELRSAKEIAGDAARTSEAIAEAARQLDLIAARLESLRSVSPGLPVAEAARYLNVTEPTIRSWLKRGVLKAVPAAKPTLVERGSLRAVRRATEELRQRGQDGDWLRALVDLLHDRAERDRPEVRQGLAEFERREFEPA